MMMRVLVARSGSHDILLSDGGGKATAVEVWGDSHDADLAGMAVGSDRTSDALIAFARP